MFNSTHKYIHDIYRSPDETLTNAAKANMFMESHNNNLPPSLHGYKLKNKAMHTQLAERLNFVRMQLATNFEKTIHPIMNEQIKSTSQSTSVSNNNVQMVEPVPVIKTEEWTNSQIKTFRGNLERLNKYFYAKKHYPIRTGNTALYKWVLEMRRKKTLDSLPALVENELNEFGFIWNKSDENFPQPAKIPVGRTKKLSQKAGQRTKTNDNENNDLKPKHIKLYHVTGTDRNDWPLLTELYHQKRLNDYYVQKVERWLKSNDKQDMLRSKD